MPRVGSAGPGGGAGRGEAATNQGRSLIPATSTTSAGEQPVAVDTYTMAAKSPATVVADVARGEADGTTGTAIAGLVTETNGAGGMDSTAAPPGGPDTSAGPNTTALPAYLYPGVLNTTTPAATGQPTDSALTQDLVSAVSSLFNATMSQEGGAGTSPWPSGSSQRLPESLTSVGHAYNEDPFHGTGDTRLLHHMDNTSSWAPMGLLTILILALLGNLLTCLAIRLDRRLHHMTFYFFISMAILHIVMAAVLMPPAVVVVMAGQFVYSEELCKLWITLDLFFCNNTCLHLAFCNMDTFLRLKDPLRHGRGTATTSCSLVLWLGAPWVISLVQGLAQFMLSQADHNIVREGICFISDKNFIILGTLFSFLIPTIISVTFYGLCVHEINVLKEGRFLDESEASTQNVYHYASNESIPDDLSDSTSCVSDVVEQHQPREQVQLAVVTSSMQEGGAIKQCVGNGGGDGSGGGGGGGPTNVTTREEVTSFCDDVNTDPVALGDAKGEQDHSVVYGHTNIAFTDHLLSTDQSASCTLLLRGEGEGRVEHSSVRLNAEHDHSSPDEALRQELAISRLMFILLLFSITLWIPISAANIVYGICKHCRDNMTFDEMVTFKWLAYSSAMIGPCVYLKFSEQLREAFWSMFLCRYCRWS